MKIKLQLVVHAFCFVSITNVWAQGSPIGGPSGIGKWSSVIPFDMVPVSISNLPNGKLLMWSAEHATEFHDDEGAEAHTMTSMYDPVTKLATPTTVGHAHHNMFCPGISNLADGRILVTGGISSANTSIYDPKTDRWSPAEDMNFGRGYQGAVTLSNGASFTIGGSWSGGTTNIKPAEIWTAESGWCTLPNIPIETTLLDGIGSENEGLYREDNHSWLWPAPNGKLFHAGPSSKMHWIDPAPGAVYPIPGTAAIPRGNDTYSMEGTTVMYDKGKILKVGGSTSYSKLTPASRKCFSMDINQYNVQVTNVGDMDYPRIMHNSVMLPDGRVIVVGGIDHAEPFSDTGAILTPEIWSPATYPNSNSAYPAGQWNTNTLPAMQTPRTYHSVGLLLADGTVFVGGGGLCANCNVNHTNAEIYYPNYLFLANGTNASRPSITSAPEIVAYNSNINVTTSSSLGAGGYFSLIRMSSVTHSTNNDQRYLKLNPTLISGSSYTMYIEGANILPPGYYMLFAVDGNGVPSIAKSIKIGDEAKPCVIKPRYSIDGIWTNGRPTLGVAAGKQLVLSMFPEGQAFTISKVGGQTITGNLNLGAVTTDKSGKYIITTTANGGCSTTLDLTVANCSSGSTVPAYAIANGPNPLVWVPVPNNPTVTLQPNSTLFLGRTTPATGKFIIKLPNGKEAVDYNYKIGTLNSSHNGVYTVTSEQGCSSTFNLNVPCIIPEYNVKDKWYNGTEGMDLSVQKGTRIVLSMMPNDDLNFTIKYPNGTVHTGDQAIESIDWTDDGIYTFTSPKHGCSTTMNLKVVNQTCDPQFIVPQYRINNVANPIWVTGTQDMALTVAPGTSITLSMMPDNIALTNIVFPNGEIHPDNYTINSVQAIHNGVYTFTSSTGCTTTMRLNVNTCSETSILPEYNLNGIWYTGVRGQRLKVANGTPVILSIMPNDLGVTIKKPDGVVMGDNTLIGNVTAAQNGIYTFTSAQGCITTLDLSVTCTITPEYNLNGWASGKPNMDLTVPAGNSLILSMLPNDVGFTIVKPDKTLASGDYSIAKVSAANKGVYTIISNQGCTSTINVEVAECPPANMIPQYNLNSSWMSGKQNMNLIVEPNKQLILSMLPDNVAFSIKTPTGAVYQNDYNIASTSSANNGVYTITSTSNPEGCTTTLNLTVASCSPSLIIPEYRLNGSWFPGTQNMTLSIPKNSQLALSMLPNDVGTAMIFKPNGDYNFGDWDLGNVTSAQNGKYTIVSDQGCLTTLNLNVSATKVATDIASDQNKDEENTITIFPNPFSNAIILRLPSGNTFHTILLVDVLGRTLKTKSLMEGETETSFDLTDELLNEGIYILKVEGRNGIFSKPVIYQKN